MAVVNGLQSLQTGTQLENLINKCELPVSLSGSFIQFQPEWNFRIRTKIVGTVTTTKNRSANPVFKSVRGGLL